MKDILNHLANQGITTSLVYGPCGDKGIMWSVDVLTSDHRSFDKPFAADSYEAALKIALLKCCEHGWSKPLLPSNVKRVGFGDVLAALDVVEEAGLTETANLLRAVLTSGRLDE